MWFLLTAAAGARPGYLVTVLPAMLLLGGGFAFGFSSIMAQATDGIDDSEQGLASGLVQSSGQVGTALVLAVVTAILGAGTAVAADFTAFRPGVGLVTAVALAGLALNLVPLLFRRPGRHVAVG